MSSKFHRIASVGILCATIALIEGSFRLWEKVTGTCLFTISDFVFAEHLWAGRNPQAVDNPIASFDKEIGWTSDRFFNLSKSKVPIVAFFGDSWTYGLGVHESQSFPSQMNHFLPSIEGRNFGVNGYGIDQMVLLAERIAPQLNPQLIIINFIANDLHRSCFSFYFGKRKPRWPDFNTKTADPSHILTPEELGRFHQRPWEGLKDKTVATIFKFRTIKLLASVVFEGTLKHCTNNFNLKLFERALGNWGNKVMFVHLEGKLPLEFISLASQKKLNIVSIASQIESLRRTGDIELDAAENHPGPNYHRLIAKLIAKEIARYFKLQPRIFQGSVAFHTTIKK